MRNKKHKGNQRLQPRHYSKKDAFRLYLIYWLLIFMVVVMALFSVGLWLPAWAKMLIYVSSLILAGIATYVHVTPGQKTQIDKSTIEDLANELK